MGDILMILSTLAIFVFGGFAVKKAEAYMRGVRRSSHHLGR